MTEAGHNAWLVGPGRSGPEGSKLISSSTPVPANRSVAPIGLDPRLGARLRAAIDGADLVHVHEPLTPLVSWAALRAAVPLVGTFHADPPPWVRVIYRVGRLAVAAAIGRLSAATAVSKVAAEAVADLTDRVEVIPNGVSTAAFRPGDRGEQRVAFLGRDEPRKGLDVLLEAWPVIAAANSEAELVVMGAVRASAPPGVRLLGEVDEDRKQGELAQTDVLCAPNLGGESFGIAVVEAMASGCAVVASDLPGFRDTLGGAGLLVPPGDPQALAAAVSSLLQDMDRRARLQEAARTRAKEFDWSVVLPAYEAVYERVLHGG